MTKKEHRDPDSDLIHGKASLREYTSFKTHRINSQDIENPTGTQEYFKYMGLKMIQMDDRLQ